jgi:polyhydroxyalkanoate synthesis regulator phasin
MISKISFPAPPKPPKDLQLPKALPSSSGGSSTPPRSKLRVLQRHGPLSNQAQADLWFFRVHLTSGLILIWALIGYMTAWGVLEGARDTPGDSQRVSRIVITAASAIVVHGFYPPNGHLRRARVTAAHTALLATAVVLHFTSLLTDVAGNTATVDGGVALSRARDGLANMAGPQVLIAFGVPFVFFYISLFSVFAHARALHCQRMADREAAAKEIEEEEVARPQHAAMLRHLDALVRRGEVNQEEYIERRNELLNTLQPKPLTVAERLRLVDDLRKEGVITEDEYMQKRNDLLNSV